MIKWAKFGECRARLGEPLLLHKNGEILDAVYVLCWNPTEEKVQWFIYQDDIALPECVEESDSWVYLIDLPTPEGE